MRIFTLSFSTRSFTLLSYVLNIMFAALYGIFYHRSLRTAARCGVSPLLSFPEINIVFSTFNACLPAKAPRGTRTLNLRITGALRYRLRQRSKWKVLHHALADSNGFNLRTRTAPHLPGLPLPICKSQPLLAGNFPGVPQLHKVH